MRSDWFDGVHVNRILNISERNIEQSVTRNLAQNENKIHSRSVKKYQLLFFSSKICLIMKKKRSFTGHSFLYEKRFKYSFQLEIIKITIFIQHLLWEIVMKRITFWNLIQKCRNSRTSHWKLHLIWSDNIVVFVAMNYQFIFKYLQ